MIRRLIALATATLCALALTIAVNAQTPPPGKKDHAFKGKVEKVDPKTKMVTVNNENIPGWMMSMTMSYKVDKPSEGTLDKLKPGDQITATVYDGDFNTLYSVKVVPPAPKK
jgi:Cu/Ag efflux protein CusF